MKIGKIITNGIDKYVIDNVLPEGYCDISSVSNWIQIGDFLFKDYKFIRKQLQEIDFSTLTVGEKTIVCQYRATTEENCKAILGDSFDYWMTQFDLKSQDCRKERFALLKTVFIKNVSLMDRYTVLGFLNTTQIENNYLKFGIEGTASNDPIEGIIDFIEATGSYLSTGVATMNLTMIGNVTQEEMIIQMSNIIKKGSIE